MKNILIIGKSGQLARAIYDRYNNDNRYNLVFLGKDEFDITDEKSTLDTIYNLKIKFDYCINCAAYTNVNKAEIDYDSAIQINEEGAKNIAFVCKRLNIKEFYISTDYVFSGENYKPYKISDETLPLSIYGKTKLHGENISAKYGNCIIIRTSWLYYDNGNNFPNKMIQLMKSNNEVKIVNDQIGCPTYALDLAEAIFSIIESDKWIYDTGKYIYHFSNSGAISWYDFCCAIKFLCNLKCNVIPISSSEFNSLAKRPHYSVMDCSNIKCDFGIEQKWWFDSLQNFISKTI